MITITYKNKITYKLNNVTEFIQFLREINKIDQININNHTFMTNLFLIYDNTTISIVKFKQSWGKNFKGKSKFQVIFWETRGFSPEEALSKSKSFSSKAATKLHNSRTTEERKRIAKKANKKRIQQMKDLEKNDPQKFKESLSTTIEFYLAKGMTQEEAEQTLKERQSTFSKKKMIEKYGENEGLKKVKERNKKWIKSLKENNDWNELSKSKAVTLEKFITKYGEKIGTEKYNKWLIETKPTVENFIRKYGEEEGKNQYFSWLQKINTMNKCEHYLEKFGEEEGMLKWKKRLDKISINQGKASKESLKIFLPLLNTFKNNYKCYLGYDNYNEWFIWDNDQNKQYRYDFTLREPKLIIEYHGETFHPNKNRLNESEWNNWFSPFSKENANEVYQKDQQKKKVAEENGFKVLELWSSTPIDKNISIATEFIKENI